VLGGLWSVAYADVFPLGLVAIGLAAALPFVIGGAGGFHHIWTNYLQARPDGGGLVPSPVAWWDTSLMLIFGGIPWNCYFQRVLSCRTPRDASRQSMLSGVMTIAFTVPPLLMGMAAFTYPWPADIVSRLQVTPADTMPLLFARS